jgi:predicted ABC-type ATPase
MINRINDLFNCNETFALETTLSSKNYKHKIKTAKDKGYNVTLVFFWLDNVEIAKEKVKNRVSEGGHNIEINVIERKVYKRDKKSL